MSYLADVEVNEIEAYRYWLDEGAFNSQKYKHENSCQCKDFCVPRGGLDIEECQHGMFKICICMYLMMSLIWVIRVDYAYRINL